MDNASATVKMSNVEIQIGGRQIINIVAFNCYPGEWTLIYGQSGVGKSTLLRTINGLYLPTTGYIWTLGTQIPGRSKREARMAWRKTGTLLQKIALFETKNALDNVLLAFHSFTDVEKETTNKQAIQWLEWLGLQDKIYEYPSRLSGGERQRVALARAFANNPQLLILDEPTSALDKKTAEIVLNIIKELAKQGTTVIMSSHRLDEVLDKCDKCFHMSNGKLAVE